MDGVWNPGAWYWSLWFEALYEVTKRGIKNEALPDIFYYSKKCKYIYITHECGGDAAWSMAIETHCTRGGTGIVSLKRGVIRIRTRFRLVRHVSYSRDSKALHWSQPFCSKFWDPPVDQTWQGESGLTFSEFDLMSKFSDEQYSFTEYQFLTFDVGDDKLKEYSGTWNGASG